MAKTTWTTYFDERVALRLKKQDLAACERAAQTDSRTLSDWIRLQLRRAAYEHYAGGESNRPPI